jgi:septal ring factor EnvC (AmiA/AmiB activator)
LTSLIAQEIAEVNTDLVLHDKDGNPKSVRYEQIDAMLLNEFLKVHKKIEEQQANIAGLRSTVAQQQKGMEGLTAQLKEQAWQIQKVSVELEMGRAVPQTVATNP